MKQKAVGLPPEAATVRIGSALAIPGVLASLGVDPVAVLSEAGISRALFDDPDNRISFAKRSRLVQLCAERTGCAHFGLLVGAHGGLHSFGLVGLLMKYSPDVASALRSLQRYLHLHGRGGATTLTVHGNLATLGFQVYLPESKATNQIGDGALAIMFNIVRSLCGADWKPREVLFAHHRPKNARPFHQFFEVPLRFDAEQYALVFKADDLNRRLATDDPAIREMLQRQVEALESRHVDDLTRQVSTALRTALANGQASAPEIAAALSMHSRTLHRRLRSAGTSYRALMAQARFETARQMLEESAMDVRQIALLLGYADASTFTRAFRRWSGTTPARWRAGRGRVGP